MQKTLTIDGMMCKHCAAAVEKALSAVPGVTAVQVKLDAKQALVDCTEEASDASIADAVVKAGYTLVQVK